jgi:D-alanine--poly(phosphoribitol) ligase subunit 2
MNPESILSVLAEITDAAEVMSDPELPLFELQLLDSMQIVSLIVRVGQDFGVQVSPAEFDRAAWATPALFVADIQRRMAT